jgi:UDPglucose--hexose-1-phosphate uridylyltransferase
VLRGILRRMYVGLRDPDFNYVIRTAPNDEERSHAFHWYLSIVPKVSRTAGFEIGSGMFINTSLPEQSAQFLRDVAG